MSYILTIIEIDNKWSITLYKKINNQNNKYMNISIYDQLIYQGVKNSTRAPRSWLTSFSKLSGVNLRMSATAGEITKNVRVITNVKWINDVAMFWLSVVELVEWISLLYSYFFCMDGSLDFRKCILVAIICDLSPSSITVFHGQSLNCN